MLEFYWAAFAIELTGAALIIGSILRIIARRKNWFRREIRVRAYLFSWLIYFLGWLVQHSVRFRHLPHSLADLGGFLGSDLFALLLMVVFAHLAGLIAVIGLSTTGGARPGGEDMRG